MRSIRSFDLKVDFLAGEDIQNVCVDMCRLADRIGVPISGNFNGITLVARPNANPLDLENKYHENLNGKNKSKLAIAG